MATKIKYGPDLSFQASEAYKLLRTNILFSFASDKSCYVVGVTSAMRGEGKSTTSINLAYTFAEAGKKTLLIDADLRIPEVAKKLALPSKPGLSNVLVDIDSSSGVIKVSSLNDKLFVLTSGDIPPNPSELLSTPKMGIIMEALRKDFDMIVVDLPPVTVVSDALVISPLVDGFVMVVREDYADKRAVSDAIRQLQFADAKILGFAATYSEDKSTKYGYKYKKYGYKYKYNYKYKNYEYRNRAYERQYEKTQNEKVDEKK